MKSALDQFRSNIERARTLCAVHGSLESRTTRALDISDILRAALVLAVSALDHYVHEVVRLGILETHRGQRPHTAALLKFNVSLGSVRQGFLDPADEGWLDNEIRERHSWQSFEHPDKIADAIRLVSGVNLWETVASDLGDDAERVKRRLKLIVDRRNKIAHESDADPTYPNTQWPIDEQTVVEAITFVESLVASLHKAVAVSVQTGGLL